MSFNTCLENVVHNWVLGLPAEPEARNIYFVKIEGGILTYVTDGQGAPYLVGGGGGSQITLTSPNGTISITNGQDIDISQDILDSIISLHNLFPDLQGGLLDEYYHLNLAQHTYLTNVADNDLIGLILDAISIPPTYVYPTSVLSGTSGTFEVGTTLSVALTQTFTQNDGGAKISEFISKNGVAFPSGSTLSENITVPLGNTIYSGQVQYAEGDCKNNNVGVETCEGRIPAGHTTSPNKVVIGGFRRYANNIDVFPINGLALRTALIGSSVINTPNTFSFTTGTINKRFIIAIPDTKTLVSAINSGTNETLGFSLSTSITSVPDAAGTNQSYKVYTLENAVPFSSNYTINVTLI